MNRFILFLLVFFMLGQLAGALIGMVLGSDQLRMSLFLSQIFGFLAAALLAARIGLKEGLAFFDFKRVSVKTIVLAVLSLLLAMPFIFLLYQLNRMLPMPEFFLDMEEQMNEILESLLMEQSSIYILLNFLLMAVVPGFCEEIFFRGGLQKGLRLSSGNALWAIFITAFVFSAIHFQFQGFIPRFFLGLAFGYFFYLSGSLWVPVICHIFFNGLQVIAASSYPEEVVEAPDMPLDFMTLGGILVATMLSYYIFTLFKKSCSLPAGTA